MSQKGSSKKKRSLLPCVAFAVSASAVMLLTLAVFPTSLNPGLPILLGGTLALLVAIYRLTANSGRYFRLQSEIATVLFLWMLVCSVFTLDGYLTQRSVSTFVGGLAFLLAAQVGVNSRNHWRWMTYSLIAVCTVASVHAWFPALKQASVTGTLSPLKGTFVNPDTFSILPLIALCLTLGLIEKASTVGTVTNLALAGFHLLTVFATGCRASMLGFFVGGSCFIGAVMYYRKDKTEKTQLFVGFPVLLAFLAIPLVGYKFSFSSKWTRILETNAVEMEEIRFELLQHGWKAILKNPLFGSGPGTFGLSYQTVRPPDHNFMYVNIAHNDFLEMGTETGIIGMLLWCALTWFAISIPLKLVPKGRRPTEAAAVVGAVVALSTYSMFNFIIVQRPVFWAQCWLFGLALSFPSSRHGAKEKAALRLSSSVVLFLAALWAGYIGVQSLKADALYVQAQQAETKLELDKARTYYEKAAILEPSRADGALGHAALLEKIRFFEGEDNLDEQLAILQRARKASPNSVPVLIRLAETQQSAGALEGAKASLAKARQLTPHKSEVFQAQLVLLLSTDDLAEAARSLSQYTPTHWEQTRDEFEKVLYTLAIENPDEAHRISEAWLTQNSNEKGLELVKETAARARKNKEWAAERTFLKSLVQAEPDSLCFKVQLAAAAGKLEGDAHELKLLTEFKRAAKEQLAPCYDDLLKRWVKLSLGQGSVKEVRTGLSEYLKVAPNQSWARVQSADLLALGGQSSEAAKLLRLGLERRPNDAVLVLGLARIFERQGSTELALNYYREAARLEPKNTKVKAKVKELMKRR